jgi:hypothetical protein
MKLSREDKRMCERHVVFGAMAMPSAAEKANVFICDLSAA